MPESKRVYFILPRPSRQQRVVIYARVSTNDAEQLKNFSAWVSVFT